MKVTLFSSNASRHVYLANRLQKCSDELFVIKECDTVFPGLNSGFFGASAIMKNYFSYVNKAQLKIFSDLCFERHKSISIGAGDINLLSFNQIKAALSSDVYIVFGSSFIKGWLMDFLENKFTINLHMGVSPFYRGSSCNFWAAYDGRFDLVGGTVHELSRELDDGDIFATIQNKKYERFGYFDGSMLAVKDTLDYLVDVLQTKQIFSMSAEKQDPKKLLRYSLGRDFTEEVVVEFFRKYRFEDLSRN